MIRGDVWFSFVWNSCAKTWPDDYYQPYRFRIDPVPGIHKSCQKYKYIRNRLHTHNERCAWFAGEGLGRSKRSPHLLPTDYEDFARSNINKSWKNRKIRKQWGRPARD